MKLLESALNFGLGENCRDCIMPGENDDLVKETFQKLSKLTIGERLNAKT